MSENVIAKGELLPPAHLSRFAPRTYLWLGGVIGYWVGQRYNIKLPFIKKAVKTDAN